MTISHTQSLHVSCQNPFRLCCSVTASLDREIGAPSTISSEPTIRGAKERVKKLLHNIDISVSSYDTAWVAMVPSPHLPNTPLFPKCLNWVLDNQLQDGSWSLPHHNALLLKDVLSSTLASVLALKKWGIGQQLVEKGAQFIELNFASVMDENLYSPIGFDIIFPGMLDYGRNLNLNLQLESGTLNALLLKRDQQLRRCLASPSQKMEAYLAYISEGIGELQNWDKVMKYQRKNGSLFNSPSTSAAAFILLQNPGCCNYLNSVVEKFGCAVPAVHPFGVYARLCLVDHIERLGVSRYFTSKIQEVLNDSYRSWMQGDEEIFDDASTCSLTFRLLREHGYNVSSGPLRNYSVEEDCFSSSLYGNSNDIGEIVELYKALEMIMHEDESALEEQRIGCKNILDKAIADDSISKSFTIPFRLEVEEALKFPCHSTMQRVINRRLIERYGAKNTKILKTSYCSSNLGNNELLDLAVEDYNQCQLIHQEELKEIARWVTENRLDQLKFARKKSVYCYFSAAATMFAPEYYDARVSWAKHAFLTSVVDDFFDGGGSLTELKNLTELSVKGNVNISTDCCSEHVQIIFAALRGTIIESGHRASILQGRNVTSHINEIWLDCLYSMLREAEWEKKKYVPTLDEYMENASITIAVEPFIVPTMYLLGPKLPEAVAQHSELCSLFKHVSTGGRLLNDIQGFQRDKRQGKLNAITLRMIHEGMSEDEAIAEVKRTVTSVWRRVLRLVVEKDGSMIPKACKDLCWNMSRVLQQFYKEDDGYSSNDMNQLVNSIIYEPVFPPPPVKNL